MVANEPDLIVMRDPAVTIWPAISRIGLPFAAVNWVAVALPTTMWGVAAAAAGTLLD